MSWPRLGLGLLLLVPGAAGEPEEKKPVPLYTNEDLERVSPLRDQTGVSSSVTVPREPAASRRAADDGRARSEAYWRREADRLQERLRPERDRIEDLRTRIAERESQSLARSRSRRAPAGTGTPLEDWRRQLAALEARVREAEARFEERARRAGALPGWLR
jgi:chromosome segregation ATPase